MPFKDEAYIHGLLLEQDIKFYSVKLLNVWGLFVTAPSINLTNARNIL